MIQGLLFLAAAVIVSACGDRDEAYLDNDALAGMAPRDLIRVLGAGDTPSGRAAKSELRSRDLEALVPVLKNALRTSSGYARRTVLEILADLSDHVSLSREDLQHALSDPDPDTRLSALIVAESVDPSGDSFRRKWLLGSLKDQSGLVRYAAVVDLLALGGPSRRVLEKMFRSNETPSDVRYSIGEGMTMSAITTGPDRYMNPNEVIDLIRQARSDGMGADLSEDLELFIDWLDQARP